MVIPFVKVGCFYKAVEEEARWEIIEGHHGLSLMIYKEEVVSIDYDLR